MENMRTIPNVSNVWTRRARAPAVLAHVYAHGRGMYGKGMGTPVVTDGYCVTARRGERIRMYDDADPDGAAHRRDDSQWPPRFQPLYPFALLVAATDGAPLISGGKPPAQSLYLS